ncbi:MAG: DUF4180 domain-containing protein [Christensenellales bacterium]
MSRAGSTIAVLEKQDALKNTAGALTLMAEVFAKGCQGLVIPTERLFGALPLLTGDTLGQMAQRFPGLSLRVAVAGDMGAVVGKVVQNFIRKAGLDAFVVFAPDRDAAVEALLGPA